MLFTVLFIGFAIWNWQGTMAYSNGKCFGGVHRGYRNGVCECGQKDSYDIENPYDLDNPYTGDMPD